MNRNLQFPMMAPEAVPIPPPADAGVRPPFPRTNRRARSGIVSLILIGPLVFYLTSFWLVRPLSAGPSFSLSLAAPVLFGIGLVTITIPRNEFLKSLRAVGFEFTLLGILTILSLLSLINSSEPFRSLRVIFPCLLPPALFVHLVVLGATSKGWLLKVPRLFVISGLLLSVAPFYLSLALPPLKGYLFSSYRLTGFFENAIQHAIALGVLLPLVMAEFLLAKRLRGKLGWGLLFVLLAYTQFRTGAKAPMAISFGLTALFYLAVKIPSQSFLRNLLLGAAIAGAAVFLWFFGLDLAKKLDPTIGDRIESIVRGGIANYHSIESRKLLWDESIRQGKEHWLVGSGAGERVLGVSHSHNLILDYFRGVGLLGAAAIALLCLVILGRAAAKGLGIFLGLGDDTDRRISACFVAAAIYVVCNQMSDSFGPSTVGALWCAYLPAVLIDRERRRRHRSGRFHHLRPISPAPPSGRPAPS